MLGRTFVFRLMVEKISHAIGNQILPFKMWYRLWITELLSSFLVGIQVDLKKRVKHIDDIVQAFDLKNPKLLDQVKNINSINFINCQKYKIEEKLKKINISKWSPEELKIHQKVSLTLRIQTKLVDELKEIMVKSTENIK